MSNIDDTMGDDEDIVIDFIDNIVDNPTEEEVEILKLNMKKIIANKIAELKNMLDKNEQVMNNMENDI